MEIKYIILLVIYALCGVGDTAQCEHGWIPYKDFLCIKIFNSFVSYQDARDVCSAQGNDASISTLVMVKDVDMQNLLANYTRGMFDYLWLGGKYEAESAQIKWEDGEPLTYTNWQEGYPQNVTSDACIELRPDNDKAQINEEGKWADVNCQKRNMVMCQRDLSWSLEDAINEIIRIRKQHIDDLEIVHQRLSNAETESSELREELQATQQDLVSTRLELATTKQDLQTVATRVVPVGSMYVEYYNQPSARRLWPTLTWQDVSSTYAGLFFRVSGGGSADWGSTQSECAPRITSRRYAHVANSNYPINLTLPSDGLSDYGLTGYHGSSRMYEATRFYTSGCEVRPINQAIRLWKRTA